MEKIHTRRIDRLAQPIIPGQDRHCHRLLTLPEMQQPSMHKRVHSFSMSKSTKANTKPSPKQTAPPKHVKHYSELPIYHSHNLKNLRTSQSNDHKIYLRRSKQGEIVRNLSSRDQRDDTPSIIQWSSVRHRQPLQETAKINPSQL